MGKYKIEKIKTYSGVDTPEEVFAICRKLIKSGNSHSAYYFLDRLLELAEKEDDEELINECNKIKQSIINPWSVVKCRKDAPADSNNLPKDCEYLHNGRKNVFHENLNSNAIAETLLEIFNNRGNDNDYRPFIFVAYTIFKYRAWLKDKMVTHFFGWISYWLKIYISEGHRSFEKIPKPFKNTDYQDWDSLEGKVVQRYLVLRDAMITAFTDDEDDHLKDKDEFYRRKDSYKINR